mmetsp:Transcript_92260/g.214320  ORF Transcript_92260/g.214320 Transcript_92260/m.214320 type:complete len:221 (+) Transcript_92260:1159-1821(+)
MSSGMTCSLAIALSMDEGSASSETTMMSRTTATSPMTSSTMLMALFWSTSPTCSGISCTALRTARKRRWCKFFSISLVAYLMRERSSLRSHLSRRLLALLFGDALEDVPLSKPSCRGRRPRSGCCCWAQPWSLFPAVSSNDDSMNSFVLIWSSCDRAALVEEECPQPLFQSCQPSSLTYCSSRSKNVAVPPETLPGSLIARGLRAPSRLRSEETSMKVPL